MWGRKRRTDAEAAPADPPGGPLREALRQARIDSAERMGVVVDLRDAELARLELLNEALDPLFTEIPPGIDLFDRGISQGDTPRLWLDAVAHIDMGRDKRRYRFLQDTRYGRRVLADSTEIAEIVDAVTHYIAGRMIERERALVDGGDPGLAGAKLRQDVHAARRRQFWRTARVFLFGVAWGAVILFVTFWIIAIHMQG
jgi:hypothetical protein